MKKEKLFILKVSLSHDKGTWRRIEILGNQSLDELHESIFLAFDRFDPHMYSFYLTPKGSKSRRRFAESPEYTHPYAIESDIGFGTKKLNDATKTKISAINLKTKDKFEYLFDFGDEWLHEITVEEILDIYPNKDYPVITAKKGESPPQYQDYEDEDEDEDEEVDHDGLEETCDQIRESNEKIMMQFEKYLSEKNLSKSTIDNHLSNIDFYINVFLLYEAPHYPHEGIDQIDYFLGSWFIRKAMWSSETSIKSYIASLKHFYTFMAEAGKVKSEDLVIMKKEIKECKNDWIENLKRYEDPNASLDDVW